MKDLIYEQENLINDCHEKRLLEEDEKNSKVVGKIPIDQNRFNQILTNIGRKKQEVKSNV